MQMQTLEGFRLSPQQKRLWLLQQKESGLPYRVAGEISIEGDLDKKILATALQKVVDRHEILRTIFYCLPGMTIPLQAIAENCQISIGDGVETESQNEWLFPEWKQQPFNFEKGPLGEFSLVTLSPKKHKLFVNLSALIADSATIGNFARELSRSYSACLRGEEVSDETMQYADIAEWQNQLLESEETEAGKEFWSKFNLSTHSNLTFVFEDKNPENAEFNPQILRQKLTANWVSKIETLAQKTGINTSDILLACWLVLLWRNNGQQDAIVGIAGDGRKYEELKPALGLMSKYLPLQCSLEASISFRELLQQVNEATERVLQWQEYFTWKKTVEGEDFLPICFEFEEALETNFEAGLSLAIENQYACVDRFKVKLSCLHRRDSIITEFHYDAALFEPEDIERFSEQFQTLVESAVNYPEAAIAKLEIASDRLQRQLLVEFNKTQVDYPEKCIHQIFEEQVERVPDKIAVVFEDRQLTYRELNERANKIAHYLQQLGVQTEDAIGLFVWRSLDAIAAMLGILKAGGAYLPLDPALPAESIAFRLQDAKAPVLLTQHSLAESLPETQAHIVYLDTDILPLSSGVFPSVSPDNLAYIIYTSGSTGKPKGVATEHRQIFNYVNAIASQLNLLNGDRFATVTTLAADLGNTAIFPALCSGGCLHVVSQDMASDPEALSDYFSRHPIDYLKIVPSHLNAFLTAANPEKILPKKGLIVGGEALSWKLVEKVQQYRPNCQIINHYGPTETTIGVLTNAIANQTSKHQSETVPLGRPLANTQIYILDEHLQPVPVGVPGELHIGGKGLTRGYLNQLELTAEKFIRNPFIKAEGGSLENSALVSSSDRLYKTGDLARYLPDGNVEFLGRIDQQVKIRGFRIEPGEIESAILQYSAIRETVVLAREDESGNNRLVAYIITQQLTDEFSLSELRSFLKQKLPEFMIPSTFVQIKVLPLTPNGKIDRKSLPAPDSVRPELEGIFVAPRTPIEATIAKIWAEVLELERVGIYDNFFELGGDSIVSIRIAARINRSGLKITPKQLFECPTVVGLAAVAIPIAPAEKTLPLTPFQQSFFEDNLSKKPQILLLEMSRAIAPDLLKRIVQHLIQQHDALRVRFIATASGWQQMFADVDEINTEFFSYIDLSKLPEIERERDLKAATANLQASLNPVEGILFHLVLFKMGDDLPDRLLFVVHQLAADSVSWRILLEDLSEAIAQISQGKEPQLTAKAASFQQWCEFVRNYAQSPQIQPERNYWLAAPQQVVKLPTDAAIDDAKAEVMPVLVSLNVNETRALIEEVSKAYRTQTDEILLTALVQTFNQWMKGDSLWLDVEVDGRAIAKEIDFSRTVGCFTTVFSALLSLERISQSEEALKAIKEQLRSVPNGGIGCGVLRYLSDDAEMAKQFQISDRAEVKFHYRERFESMTSESIFKIIDSTSSDRRDNYQIEINGFIFADRLQLEWNYNEQLYRRSTIENLAKEFVEVLRQLVDRCQSSSSVGYTPSDFPQANLNQKDLERFIAKLNRGKSN